MTATAVANMMWIDCCCTIEIVILSNFELPDWNDNFADSNVSNVPYFYAADAADDNSDLN